MKVVLHYCIEFLQFRVRLNKTSLSQSNIYIILTPSQEYNCLRVFGEHNIESGEKLSSSGFSLYSFQISFYKNLHRRASNHANGWDRISVVFFTSSKDKWYQIGIIRCENV